MTGDRSWQPLAGISVVDLTSMLPGGTATGLLAGLGADVVKVEPPAGDPVRALTPAIGTESSVQHYALDHGKRSIRLDLKQPAGVRTVRELGRDADAVIESFRPGVADRLGVGYRALSGARPQLTYLSLSGYGRTGPRAGFAGHDLNFLSLAGALGPGIEMPALQVADITGGMLAALGVLAGVHHARATGRGEHIDLALADAALTAGAWRLAALNAAAASRESASTVLDGGAPCYRIYSARDGRRVVFGGIEPKFWTRVVDILGHAEWASRQHDPSLIPVVAALIASEDGAFWKTLLERPDTCVTVERTALEVVRDEHFTARRSLVLDRVEATEVWRTAAPFQLVASEGEAEE